MAHRPGSPSAPAGGTPAAPSSGAAWRQGLWDALDVGLVAIAPDGSVDDVNVAFTRMTGVPHADAVGTRLPYPWWPPEEAAAREALLRSDLRGRTAHDRDTWFVRRDGTRLDVSLHLGPVPGYAGLVTSLRDISHIAASERAAQAAEERLRASLAAAGDGAWELDLVTGRTAYSGGVLAMLGLTEEGPTAGDDAWRPTGAPGWTYEDGMLVSDGSQSLVAERIHPADRERAVAAVAAHISGERPEGYAVSYRLRHEDGHWVPVLTRGRVVERDEAGRPLRLVGTHTDLTRVRQAETGLASVVNAMAEGMLVHSAGGAITACNPAACQILGLTEDQILGRERFDRAWRDVTQDGDPFPPEDHPAAITLRTGRPVRGVVLGTWNPAVAERRWLSVSSEPMGEPGAEGRVQAVVVTFADVTERIQSERQEAARRRITELVATATPPRRIFARVAEEVGTLMGADAASLTRYDGDTGRVLALWVQDRHDPGAFPERLDLRESRSVAGAVWRADGVPQRLQWTRDAPEMWVRHVGGDHLQAVGVPVRLGGLLWGSLAALWSRDNENPLPADTEQRLSRFADLVALALDAAFSRAHLEEAAYTDSLTGLPNHRAFQEQLRQEVARAERYGRPLCLLLLDLDHFKAVNDTLGHQRGDRVLQSLARELRGLLRAADVAGRVGGEEFGVLMPDADLPRATAAAERLLVAVREHRLDGLPVTVSIGVAQFRPGQRLERFYGGADAALYRAKRAGRDRVAVADRPSG